MLIELSLKVYFIEFCSLWKTCGTQNPMGHEEEIGTNNFCPVELDLLLRISTTFNIRVWSLFIVTSILLQNLYDLSVV